jgi:type IV pilus assembly protein PilM
MGWRKKQAAAVEVEADVAEPETPADKPVPFWKREAAKPPVRESGPGEGARGNREVPPTTEEAAEKPTPFWKREISFNRRTKADAVADVAPVEEVVAADEPTEKKPSIWKRELSFGRKSKEAEPVEPVEEEDTWRRDLIFGTVEPEVGDEPVAEAQPEPDPEPLPEPVFFELPPDAEPEYEPEQPAVEERPSWAAPPTASVSSAYGWLTDDLAPADLASTSWAGTQAPVPIVPAAPEPEPEPEPEEIVAEVVEPERVPEPEPEPVFEAAALPVVPLPRPEIHPPVTAAELPALAVDAGDAEEKEKKPSFLKRDLSFRRRAKEQQPATADELAEDAPEEAAEKKSLLKRDLSFRRKPKPEAEEAPPKPERRRSRRRGAAEPVAEQPEEPKPPKEKRRGKGVKVQSAQRHKKLVGLKVGASQLAAARVHNNGSAQLVQLARQDLEPGVVVGGELRDPEALAQALKAFFKKHKLPKTGVRLGIANNRIGVRTFDLAGIEDPKQLANAIRFRAQEALPIPIEEAVLDYRILGETESEDGGTARRILLVVAYRDLVNRYVDACRKAGIKLVGIDLEAFALLRALAAPADEGSLPEAATVAVAIGHERSTFAVSDGRVCEFTRVLEWGGASLNVAIARSLDLAPSEAEPIKRELSLAAEADVEGLEPDQVAQAREAVLRQVQAFARELVSSLQFYQGQPGSLGIAEITITGGTAHLPGLAAELERLIGVRVRVGDPLARVRVGKKVGDEDQIGSLAVAIGLGIDD